MVNYLGANREGMVRLFDFAKKNNLLKSPMADYFELSGGQPSTEGAFAPIVNQDRLFTVFICLC